jgi:O-antigen ligase
VLAGLNGITINLNGYNIKLDQIASVLISIILTFKIVFSKQKIIKDKSTILLVLFLLNAIFVSLSFAPDVKYSFMQTLSIVSVAAIYILIYNSIYSDEQLSNFTIFFINLGILHCIVGIVLFILSIIGLIAYGANLGDDLVVPYGVYSTMVEPNIYGSYCLGYFIFATTMLLTAKTLNRSILLLACTSLLGLYLSFTRGVWIAAFIGFLLIIYYSIKTAPIKAKRAISILLLFIILVSIVSIFNYNSFLEYKISNLLNTSSGSGFTRLIIWEAAIEHIKEHFVFGTGTYSFATLMGNGTYDPLTNPWISNFFITILHDYGIVGFLLFSLFFTCVVFKSIRMIRNNYNNFETEDKRFLLALCLAVISMYIAFFFTTGFSLSYSWIFLGMIALYKRRLEVAFKT